MDYNTGDILLFSENKNDYSITGIVSKIVQYFTNSPYSHCGIILKDPLDYKGLYFWESTLENIKDIQDNKYKFGVAIVPLDEMINKYDGKIYYRKLHTNIVINNEILSNINDIVHNKPYDIVPMDWIEALIQKDPNPQKINRFFCSALLGYIYTQIGLLDKNTDWSILTPKDFSTLNKENIIINGTLDNEIEIK